jgi:hypothetical protein
VILFSLPILIPMITPHSSSSSLIGWRRTKSHPTPKLSNFNNHDIHLFVINFGFNIFYKTPLINHFTFHRLELNMMNWDFFRLKFEVHTLLKRIYFCCFSFHDLDVRLLRMGAHCCQLHRATDVAELEIVLIVFRQLFTLFKNV